MIGVEFGSDTMKMAVVSGGNVKSMAVERLPDNLVRDGEITSTPAMVAFMREMMKKHHVATGSRCALALPPRFVMAQHLRMPLMSDAEIRLNLPHEFRDYVGDEADLYDYDYCVMRVTEDTVYVYAAAVKREIVENYYNIFKRAGLRLRAAMPSEMAWLNLVRRNKRLPTKLGIVDIGHDFTRVDIFENGAYLMGKDIDMAGQFIEKAIATDKQLEPSDARDLKEANTDYVHTDEALAENYEAIAAEIAKVISFYAYAGDTEGEPLQDLFYCGGTAAIEPLRLAIGKATGMELYHIKRLLNARGRIDDSALVCSIAAGAAMQDK